MHLKARGQSNGRENVVVIDEFPGEMIDRCGSASRHYPQARHAPQDDLGMKLLGREGLDVPLGQSSSVYLTTRITALVRRIIRPRSTPSTKPTVTLTAFGHVGHRIAIPWRGSAPSTARCRPLISTGGSIRGSTIAPWRRNHEASQARTAFQ